MSNGQIHISVVVKIDQKEALHILSTDSRFPDVTPGKQLAMGNHFMSLFPEVMTSKRKRVSQNDQQN